MPDSDRHLLDVNSLVALVMEQHIHHPAMRGWFDAEERSWALCPFTETGLLRFLMRPQTAGLDFKTATSVVEKLQQRAGYFYQPIEDDWHTLTQSFAGRILGHNQITDGYLLGLAIRHDLVLVTFDKAFLHLAGEHRRHVLLLDPTA